MNLRKTFVTAAAFIYTLAAAWGAAAQLDFSAAVSGSKITVSGTCDPNENVALLVEKRGGAPVLAINALADGGGSFSSPAAAMPDYNDGTVADAGGIYDITAATESGEILRKSIVYISSAEVGSFIKALDGAESEAAFSAEFKREDIADILNSVGACGAEYSAAEKKTQDETAAALYGERPFQTAEKFSVKFDGAFLCAAIKNAGSDEAVKNLLTGHGKTAVTEIDGKSFAEDNNAMLAVARYIKKTDFKNADDLNREIRRGYILHLINSGGKTEISEYAAKYGADLGIDGESGFNRFKTDYDFSIGVSAEIVLARPENGFAAISDFAAVFSEKLAAAIKSGNSGGGSSGGSSSGGGKSAGSGGGSFSTAPRPSTTTTPGRSCTSWCGRLPASATSPTSLPTAAWPMTTSPTRCLLTSTRTSSTFRMTTSASGIWTVRTSPRSTRARPSSSSHRSARPTAPARTVSCRAGSP